MTAETVWNNPPYIVGSPIADRNLFFGRKRLFQFVEDNLKQGERVILLHGQRRIGKSSVILQIANFVELEEFVFIPFDLQNKGSLALSNVLHSLAEAIVNRLKLDGYYETAIPSEADLAAEPSIFSQKFLPDIYRLLGEKNLVLMLDEFDVLNNYEPTSSGQTFFPYLQSLLSQQERLFIIPAIGRQPDDLPKLLGLFRRAPTQKIGLLSREDAEKLIAEPARGVLDYDKDAIEAIFELSKGHPYFTQLLCYAVFVRARAEQRQQVTAGDVEGVIEKAIELGEGGLAWFRDGLPIPERVIFSAVAEAQKRADRREESFLQNPLAILKEYGVVQTDSLVRAGTQLVEWDFLDLAAGADLLSATTNAYRIKVDLVRRWLVKRYPLRQEIWELEKLEPAAESVYQSAADLERYDLLRNAIPLYEQALSINPNHFKALFQLAEGYLETRAFDKAVERYKRAYLFDPNRVGEDYVRSLEGYGLELMEQRRFNLAKEQFAPILIIEPDHELAREKLQEIESYIEEFNRRGLDFVRFFRASSPAKIINAGNPEERKHYIDFDPVRGNQVKRLLRTITRLSADEPTHQLFTGHIGCGKSTELLRLKAELEKRGFHTVYIESLIINKQELNSIDIWLSLIEHIGQGLTTKIIFIDDLVYEDIRYDFNSAMKEYLNRKKTKVTFPIGRDPKEVIIRYTDLEIIEGLLRLINVELIKPAIQHINRTGKEGLVVIVDNLDRLNERPNNTGRTQAERLFIDRAEQLRGLSCHVVYTIPLALTFSKEFGKLRNYFGMAPEVLSMIPVRLRDGRECEEGMALMRQMVLARAFPNLPPEERLDAISEIFDSPETLDQLCAVSGGHVRNLLSLLYRCLQDEDPPLSRTCLERAIKQYGNDLIRSISDDEWELLNEVAKKKTVRGQEEYRILIKSSFVFEYQYEGDIWFDVNPVLREARRWKITRNSGEG